MTIFSDMASKFQIIDFLTTHSQLLIRSMRNKNRKYNIDIIFKGVSVLVIPESLQGLEISIAPIDSGVNKLIRSMDSILTMVV